nr:glycosyltransferase family 4 protein [Anaerolineae bacterium]
AYILGDILCLISNETWGLVVNEAMACSLPVIVSNSVGSQLDMVTADNGWVVPSNDMEALINALCTAYEQRSEWAHMGEAARTRVSQHTFALMAEGVKRALNAIEIANRS